MDFLLNNFKEHLIPSMQDSDIESKEPTQYHPNYFTYTGDHWLCRYCGKDFKKFSTFEVHLRKHNKERPFKC